MLDENLPPRMAKALAELFRGQHEIIHLRERFGPGVSDVEWMKELNQDEQRWVVLTADRRISKNRTARRVFQSCNLVAFIFARGLQKASVLKKMERLMVMWGAIEKTLESVDNGSMFEIQVRGRCLSQLR